MTIDKLTIDDDFIALVHNANAQAIPYGDVDIIYATCVENSLKKLIGEPINAYTLSLAVANASKQYHGLLQGGDNYARL